MVYIINIFHYAREMSPQLVAAWAAIITGMVAIGTFVTAISQRKKELRWKQAELARTLIDELFEDPDAAQGFYMMDEVQYPYKDFFDNPIDAKRDDVVAAITRTLNHEKLSKKDARIMFCVDSLLYFLNRIENSLKSKLIVFGDIKTPCDYYVSLIASDKPLFTRYMTGVGYRELVTFCEQFTSWTPKEP